MRAELRHAGRLLALTALSAVPAAALAQQAGGPTLPLVVGQGAGGTSYSVPIQTLLFFTALSFLPAVLLLMTGFTRIVIVLSLLRQALGTQASPPNQVIVGLSLFLTLFVMGPTLDKVYADAYGPYSRNEISFEVALERGQAPMREFMLKQTRQSDFELFARLAPRMRVPVLTYHAMNVGVRVTPKQMSEGLRRNVERVREIFESGLERFGGPWLTGAHFSAADAFFAPVAYRIRTYGLDVGGGQAWVDHVLAHPAMLEWEAEALAEEWREEAHEAGVITADYRK